MSVTQQSASCEDCGRHPATDISYGKHLCFDCWTRDMEPILTAAEIDRANGVTHCIGGDAPNLELKRHSGEVDGATFALDAPDRVEAVWGAGTTVLWPKGEPTMLYGPDGVGKTSVAQQIVKALLGIGRPHIFGQPVEQAAGKVLYLALDRPKQAARSLRRMVTEANREVLRDKLTVWQGQVPFDLVRDPGATGTLRAGTQLHTRCH